MADTERRAAAVPGRLPVFGLVDEVRVRRRAGDAVRVAAALLVLLVVAVVAELLDPNGSAYDDAIDVVPDVLSGAAAVLLWSSSIGLAVALAVVGLVGRRTRLVLTMVVIGAVAGAAAWWLTGLFGSAGGEIVLPALAVATAGAVAPYLTRPAARVVEVVAGLGVATALVAGSGSPVAVLVSVTTGWGVVAAFRLAAGSPVGIPSSRRVAAGAAALGAPVRDLHPVDYGEWGVAAFTGTTDGGTPSLVSVYGRDAEDARLLSRTWHFLWYRSDGPSLAVSRDHQVEHEAFLLLLAAQAGAAVPLVRAAGTAAATEDALLVAERPPGHQLDELDDDRLTDDVLDGAWALLGALSQAGIAHGCPDGRRVVTDGSRVALVDFRRGMAAAPPERRARDVAQLLVTLAMRVGAERAVASAVRGVGHDHLVDAVAQLQPAAFAGETRRALHQHKGLVKDLRARTAEACGVEVPELAELRRVSWSDVALAAGTLFGFWLLIGQLSGLDGVWSTIADATWAWVLVALLISQSTNFAQAYALTGSVSTPLPFGPVVGLQFGLAFTGLIGGTVANTATIIRFFQRRGLAASVAVSSGVLVSAASSIVQALLFVLCFAFVHDDFSWDGLGSGAESDSGLAKTVLLVVVIGGLVAGVVLVVPRFRRSVLATVKPQIDVALSNLRDLAADPRLTSRLFVGNAAAQVLFALTLSASLHAYGASASLPALIVINTIASLIGGIAPVPGGMGVVEAGLIAGMTAYGIPVEQATAAVFTSRLFTAYLPPAWGWPSLAWLRRHEYL